MALLGIRAVRGAILLAGFAGSVWLFTTTWSYSWGASEKIMNSVEAGTAATVSRNTWLAIIICFTALVALLQFLTLLLRFRFLIVFRPWERLLVFSLPIALASITPLIAGPLPIVSIAVITVCVSLRPQKNN